MDYSFGHGNCVLLVGIETQLYASLLVCRVSRLLGGLFVSIPLYVMFGLCVLASPSECNCFSIEDRTFPTSPSVGLTQGKSQF